MSLELLPREMKVAVLRQLSLSELAALELVSKDWRAAARDDLLFSNVTRVTIQGTVASTNVDRLGRIQCSKIANGGVANLHTATVSHLFGHFEAGQSFAVGIIRHLLHRGADLRSIEIFHVSMWGKIVTREALEELAVVLGELGAELESLAICHVPGEDLDWIQALQGLVKVKLQRLILGPVHFHSPAFAEDIEVTSTVPWTDAVSGLEELKVLVLCCDEMEECGAEEWLDAVGGRLDCLFILSEFEHSGGLAEPSTWPELTAAFQSKSPQLSRQYDCNNGAFVWTSSQFSHIVLDDLQLHSVNFWEDDMFLRGEDSDNEY